MLRSILICPDSELSERFQQLLADVGLVNVTRVLDRYPNQVELQRYLRAHAPQVIFVGIDSMNRALEVVREVEKLTAGVQVVAVGRKCDQQILLDLMTAGIRAYASLPFDRQGLKETLMRIGEMVAEKPPSVEITDNVFAFLPSKAGVGASTIALNASLALARVPNTRTLLSDFDLSSGMMRFMLKLDNVYGVSELTENALAMDESLWPPMVTCVDQLDVLHAGKLNPEIRIEASQIRHLIEFMRRNYRALCFDLSGNLEKYSVEIMHEAKRIYLVCTPEIPSLHLAREKYAYLRHLDLGDRVSVLLNRCQKRPVISTEQIEELLGLPVEMTFPNDYKGVHSALTLGRGVEHTNELGKQFTQLAQRMIEGRQPKKAEKKRFIQYFSVVAKPIT